MKNTERTYKTMIKCPICKGGYPRTYEEHTGSEKHRAAVRKAVGR